MRTVYSNKHNPLILFFVLSKFRAYWCLLSCSVNIVSTRVILHACCEGAPSIDMPREDLIAERSAVEMYSEMDRYFGDKDLTCGTQMQSA